MLDHVPDDLDVICFLRLEFFIHPALTNFFIRIRSSIFQEGLIVLNRIFFAHQGFVQYLEPCLYGVLVFFLCVHLDFLFSKMKIIDSNWFLELYNKTLCMGFCLLKPSSGIKGGSNK